MLRFKQFIQTYLFEAKISHFSHLGLDPNNPEHKDLVDAYNAGVNRDPNVPKNPNQIKTFDQLKTSVAPHFAAIQQKRKEDEEDKKAFENKDAELVHHDQETGLKVFKVRNARGCVAAGGGATGCVYDRDDGQDAMDRYDPEGEHSHIIHTPEKGNLSRISIIGVKPKQTHRTGLGGNFQDKGNNTISDSDWDILRRKYKLDSVKALHGIRGLHNEEEGKNQEEEAKKLIKPHITDQELGKIKSNNPEVHKAIINHKNFGLDSLYSVSQQTYDPEVQNKMLEHKDINGEIMDYISDRTNNPEVHKAIINHAQYEPEIHSEIISKNSHDPEIHKILSNHPETSSKALDEIMIKSDDPEVHRNLVNHHNTSSDTLSELNDITKDPRDHKSIINHLNANRETINSIAEKYNLQHDGSEESRTRISKAIDDHIKNKQNNPYQLESFISRLRRI
jgi:hypothetical protein